MPPCWALCQGTALPQLQPLWGSWRFSAVWHRELRLLPSPCSHLRGRRALPHLGGQEPRLQEARLRGTHQLPLQARPGSLGGGEHPTGRGDSPFPRANRGRLGWPHSASDQSLDRSNQQSGWRLGVASALQQPWVTVPTTQDGAGHHVAPGHHGHMSTSPLFSCVTFFCRLKA